MPFIIVNADYNFLFAILVHNLSSKVTINSPFHLPFLFFRPKKKTFCCVSPHTLWYAKMQHMHYFILACQLFSPARVSCLSGAADSSSGN